MEIPAEVQSEIDALRAEIEELVAGPWDQTKNTAGGKALRSRAKDVISTAKKLEEAVKRNTYSPR